MDYLLIRPDLTQPDRCSWVLCDHRGVSQAKPEKGSLVQSAHKVGNRRVVLLLPGSLALMTAVEWPGNNRQQLAQAVPFLLEEDVAQDIDELHFAVGPRLPDRRVPVCVVAKADLDRWLDGYAELGVKIHSVGVDVLCLPWTDGEWSVLYEPHQALVRTGAGMGFVCDVDSLAVFLSTYAESIAAPSRIRVWNASGLPVELPSALASAERIDLDGTDNGLAVLVQGFGLRPFIELRQGPYRIKDEFGKALRPWYGAAAALVIWFGAATAHTWSETQRLMMRNGELDQAIEEVFRNTFPDAQRVVNARVQMQQRLDTLREQQTAAPVAFLPMLAEVARIVSEHKATIREMTYRGDRWSLELQTKDLQTIEAIRRLLDETEALRAELISAEAAGDKLLGRLRVERGSSR